MEVRRAHKPKSHAPDPGRGVGGKERPERLALAGSTRRAETKRRK